MSTRRKAVPYQVAWQWRDDGLDRVRFDDVEATTATHAVTKVRKALAEEYVEKPVILEVYRI